MTWREEMKSKINSESDIAKTLEIDQSPGYGKWLKRWLIIALLVVAIVTLL